MAIISSYPTVVAEANDLLIGTKVTNTGTIINPTKTFRVQEVVDSALGYTVYTAGLINAGPTAPTPNVLKNNTGGTFTWSRTGTGLFVVTIAGITVDTTKVAIFECANGDLNLGATIINPTTINVEQFSSGGGGYVDTMLAGTTIEFRIYS
jgi:hypothetical protein